MLARARILWVAAARLGPVRLSLVAIVALTACAPAGGTATQVPGGPPATVPAGAQTARVVRIVDGDTLRLVGQAAGPLSTGREERVRLLEVNAPEVSGRPECYGREARAQLRRLAPPGSSVKVVADRNLRDRFGRTLLYLWNEDGVMVNDALVASGHARAVLYSSNDRYIDTLRTTEARARADRRGQWAACSASAFVAVPPAGATEGLQPV